MNVSCTDRVLDSMSEKSKDAAYGGVRKFLSKANFDLLRSIMYPRRMQRGSYLFWEGDPAGNLFYIRSGRVNLRKSTPDGKDLILSILQKGDLIGEIGGFGETGQIYHNTTAEVISDAEIGMIDQHDLEDLLYRYGGFALQFMNWMSITHRITQTKFRDLLMFGKPGALASVLIRMSNSYGVETENGIRLDIKCTNSEMADMIGTSREGVNRMLSSLKDEGTIDTENGQIIIRQIENLRCQCNCPTFPVCPKEVCRL